MARWPILKSFFSFKSSIQILPTETQKNTCYALALKTEFSAIEDYALTLGRDILRRHAHISAVDVTIQQRTWERVSVGNQVIKNNF